MSDIQKILSTTLKLAALAVLATLTACGDGYSQKVSRIQTQPADAYLTAPPLAVNSGAIAPKTIAALAATPAPSSGSSISTGLYSPQSVTLTCTDASGSGCLATYYTMDGTTPSAASTPYAGPIAIWSKTTLKYFSIDRTGNIEPVKTQNFLIGSISIKNIKSYAAGWNHTIGLKSDGTLWAWGGNASGQLGDGTTTDKSKPVAVGTDTNWSAVAAGKLFTLALKSDGTLWAWGSNSNGQLGDGTVVDKSAPVQIGTATNWSSISAGSSFALAHKSDGTLWAWGANSKGQLGNATTTDSNVPLQIGADTAWTGFAAGYDHALALKNNGTLWAWGGNSSGQLGQNSTTDSAIPLQIPGSNWSAVSAGGSSLAYQDTLNNWHSGGHSIAMKSDGTLWAWGQNIFGQLGDGTNINMGWAGAGTYPLTGFVTWDRLLPIQIGTDTDWATISAGAGHTAALKNDGTLWAWGLNVNGQLANGNPGENNLLPLPVGADTYLPNILPKHPWVSTVAGGYQTVALRNDGTLWAWGWNGSGQLGDGSTYSTGGGSDAVTPTWKLPKYAYVVSNKVYSYTVDYKVGSGSGPNTGSGKLTPTGLSAVAAGAAPDTAALDPSGRFLYVVDSTVSTVDNERVSYIHSFSVNRATGALTEVGEPTGTKTLLGIQTGRSATIIVDPLGKFVYVTGIHSKGWNAIAVYTINPASGELTGVGTVAKGATILTVEPLGRFAYAVKGNLGIAAYIIDQRTGMLTRVVSPCQYDYCDDDEDDVDVAMDSIKYLKVDLSGQFLYAERGLGVTVTQESCDMWGRCPITSTSVSAAIHNFSINQTSGKIFDTHFIQAEPGMSSMVISPGVGVDSHTQFMYLLFNDKLNGLALNQLTGQVTDVGLDPAFGAKDLAAEPTGKLIYVFKDQYVLGYAIDPFSGKTQVIGPQLSPTTMATDAGAGIIKTLLFASY